MGKNNKQYGDGEIRQSQLISTFGVGAMVDLPSDSVIISGLNYWKGERQPLYEERLQRKISQILQVDQIKLYTPPRDSRNGYDPAYIRGFIFPTWFLAQVDETITRNGKQYRTRPFVKWEAIKAGKVKIDKKSFPVVPVRFVQACVNGHISDINWSRYVHNSRESDCLGQLWLDEAGSGNDFEEIFVRCEACKKYRALAEAKLPNSKVLGTCQGNRPWLGNRGKESCVSYKEDKDSRQLIATDKPEYNRLLVRSASNAYFSQVLSVISLPDNNAQFKKAIDKFYEEDLQYLEDISELSKELRKPKFADLIAFEKEKIWEEITERKTGQRPPEKSIKLVELQALLSAPEQRNPQSNLTKDFDAETRSLSSLPEKWKPYIDRIVLVHRLREVVAQIGFTRFDAYLSNMEEDLDEFELKVRFAALDLETKWLPAIENKGEGVFISFNKSLVDEWCKRESVDNRGKILIEGFKKGLKAKGISQDKSPLPGIPYIMLHSLSHLLITTVSLDCGYAASAIRERIYANESGYGILLYTGTSGSEGTLGGLVEVGRRIEDYLEKSLFFAQLCSNDPICAQHKPSDDQESRYFHGAACHGCLLIAETSCERRNEFLDRALVVNTVEDDNAAFFGDDLI